MSLPKQVECLRRLRAVEEALVMSHVEFVNNIGGGFGDLVGDRMQRAVMLIHVNPFEGMATSVRANPSRFEFVSRKVADQVLQHCPDAQWRVIFALAR